MATTSNYGWTTPDDSSLVKDGASAIRALGTAIDTSMNTALGTKKAGLVLLNTTSFSAVASQSLPNNTFSATYDNYRIIISGVMSVETDMNFRLRAAGSDNSTASSYVRQNLNVDGTTVTAARGTNNLMLVGAFNTTLVNSIILELADPFLASATGVFYSVERSTSSAFYSVGAGTHNQTVSYDSCTFFPTSGTMTGKVSVYGYNK